jgi:hypothetical protein
MSNSTSSTSVFVGNTQASSNIVNWIRNEIPDENIKLDKECVCIVVGNSGVGKTYGIIAAIKQCNVEVFYLNKDQCTNSKEFKDYIAKLTSSNVVLQFSNIPSRKALLFIDDIESLLDADRTFVNSFNTILNSKLNAIKIILSCNTASFKALSKSLIFGHCVLINISSVQSIVDFINSTLNETNTVLPLLRVKEIAIDSLGSLSSALNMVRMDVNSRSNDNIQVSGEINTNNTNNTNNTSYRDRSDEFPEVAKMFQTVDRHQVRYLIELDPWLHPLRFHENVLHELGTRIGFKKDKELIYTSILKNLCIWDHMMTDGKGGDISYAVEHACSTILMMRDYPKKKTYQSCASVDEFTRMFNYLSLKKKNQLALYDAEKTGFPWNEVGSMNKKMYDVGMKNHIKMNNSTNKHTNCRSKKTFSAKDK